MVSRRALFKAILSPISILAMLSSKRIHPAYRMTTWRKLKLGWRFYWNRRTIVSATDINVQLAMALKTTGDATRSARRVVECGTFKGGTAANLSLACKIVGGEIVHI